MITTTVDDEGIQVEAATAVLRGTVPIAQNCFQPTDGNEPAALKAPAVLVALPNQNRRFFFFFFLSFTTGGCAHVYRSEVGAHTRGIYKGLRLRWNRFSPGGGGGRDEVARTFRRFAVGNLGLS